MQNKIVSLSACWFLLLGTSAFAAKPIVPTAPSSLSCTPVSSSQVNLSWVDNASNESGFYVERAGSSAGPWSRIATLGINATSYANGGLSASTTYYFRVCAYNSRGTSSYAISSATTTTFVATGDSIAPTASLTAPSGGTTVSGIISLVANASDNVGVTKIDFYRDSILVGTDTTSPYSLSYNTALIPNGSHSFVAKASDAAGNVGTSPTIIVTVSNASTDTTAPTIPGGLAATAASSGQINLSWGASSDTGGSGLAGYRVYRSGSLIATVTSTSYSNTGLAPSSTYCYTVSAYDVAGNSSAQSGQACMTTPATADTTSPSIPSGLTATAASSSQMNLSWAASTDTGGSGLAGYRVYRSGSLIATVTSTSYSNTGLAAGSTYCYTVSAYDAAGNSSAQCAQKCATTLAAADTTAPSVPSGLAAAAASSSQVNLTWAASTDAGGSGLAGYRVYRSGSLLATVTSTSYSNTGLAASSTYCYTVSAYDAAGNSSAQSGQACATTSAGADTTPPAVTLMSPSAGSTVSGTISLTVSASDNVGVVKVEYWCDGTDLCATATTSPFSASDNTTTMSNGSHTYTAKAFDGAGNSTVSAGKTVTVSNTSTDPGPWVQPFGGAGDDTGRAVASDSSGNIILAGYFSGTATFGTTSFTSLGGVDFSLAKYSPNGSPQWIKSFGSTGNEMVTSIALDSSGNIFVAGYFAGTANLGGANLISAGGYDMFLAKYSSTGAHQWSRSFGGTANDMATGVAVDSAGNVILAGTYQGSASFGGSVFASVEASTDVVVAKYSTSGTHLWSEVFGNSSDDLVKGVAVDRGDNILLTGYFYCCINFGGGWLTANSGTDYFIAKLSSTGGYLWARNYGGASGQRAFSLSVDANGDPVVLGDFNMQMDNGKGVILTSGDTDAFVAKCSGVDGSSQWTVPIGGQYTQTPASVATDAQKNVVVTGYFTGGATLGSTLLSSHGGIDFFVAKYSPLGVLSWARAFGGTLTDFSSALAVDPSGHPIVAGAFNGTALFDSVSQISRGGNDGFLLRLMP